MSADWILLGLFSHFESFLNTKRKRIWTFPPLVNNDVFLWECSYVENGTLLHLESWHCRLQFQHFSFAFIKCVVLSHLFVTENGNRDIPAGSEVFVTTWTDAWSLAWRWSDVITKPLMTTLESLENFPAFLTWYCRWKSRPYQKKHITSTSGGTKRVMNCLKATVSVMARRLQVLWYQDKSWLV